MASRKLALKNNKGFTLAEVLIGLAITAILAVVAISATQFTLQTYTTNEDLSMQNVVYASLQDYVTNELRYAEEVQIGGVSPSDEYYTIEIVTGEGEEQGVIKTDGVLFPYSYYFYSDNHIVEPEGGNIFSIGGTTAPSVIFNLSLKSDKGNEKEETINIKLENMVLNDEKIVVGGSNTNVIHYIKK